MTGNPTIPFDIFDSLTMIAESWNSVSVDTIKHSWQRTGILPLESGGTSSETNEHIISEVHDSISSEIVTLLREFPLADGETLMSQEEYIHCDEHNRGIGIPTDTEIIEMVTVKETDDEEENNEAVPIVSVTEALECLDKFTNFLRQNSVNVSVTADFLGELRYVQRSLTLEKAYCMKQSTLDHFYNLNQH
jgi:hypothetical protein